MRLSVFFRLGAWLAAGSASAAAAGGVTLVAPLSNRTGDPSLDWIGESISETVREALGGEGAPVVRREDRLQAASKLSLQPASPWTLASGIKLAEATGAALVLYGHFTLEPAPERPDSRGALRITARLFDRVAVLQREEFLEVGPLENLAMLQTQLAWQALEALRPSQRDREQFLEQHPPVKVNALEHYIRGLMAPSPEQRHRFFTLAARFDPAFPHPCFYLGKMHFEKDNYREAAAWFARVGAGRGFHLEAGFLLGLSRYETGDFRGALQAFERVAASLETPEVHNNLGAVLLRLDRPEALAHFRKALDAVPSDPDYHFNVGYSLWKRGDFEAAAERFRAVLDREQEDPDAVLLLGRCLKKAGPRPGDARGEGLERMKDGWEEPARALQ
jgi:Flp pilus assembly protein TadD